MISSGEYMMIQKVGRMQTLIKNVIDEHGASTESMRRLAEEINYAPSKFVIENKDVTKPKLTIARNQTRVKIPDHLHEKTKENIIKFSKWINKQIRPNIGLIGDKFSTYRGHFKIKPHIISITLYYGTKRKHLLGTYNWYTQKEHDKHLPYQCTICGKFIDKVHANGPCNDCYMKENFCGWKKIGKRLYITECTDRYECISHEEIDFSKEKVMCPYCEKQIKYKGELHGQKSD